MAEPGFDAGLYAAQRWRRARRWALLLFGVALFVELQGVPHLRITYEEQGDRVVWGTYWSVTGLRQIVAGEVAPSCPLIAVVPLDRSLVSYLAENIGHLMEK